MESNKHKQTKMTKLLSKSQVISQALLACFFFSSLAHAETQSQSVVEMHVGIYAPFSNEQAFIGRNILGAMEMARDKAQKGPINYSFYTLDKASEYPVTAATLQKFIDVHHLTVLLTEGSSSGLMAAPIASKNNIIHFNMAQNAQIADGKNNFSIWNAQYQATAVLDEKSKPDFVASYKKIFESHPVTEAGYAFDVFDVINKSAVLAMKDKTPFSSEKIAQSIQGLAVRDGIMGAIHADKPGIFYAQSEAVEDSKVQIG